MAEEALAEEEEEEDLAAGLVGAEASGVAGLEGVGNGLPIVDCRLVVRDEPIEKRELEIGDGVHCQTACSIVMVAR